METILESPDSLRRAVADLIEEEPAEIDPERNLFELGLNSITLMRMLDRWRRAGATVTFADLAERPTLAAWTTLLSRPVEPGTAAVSDTPQQPDDPGQPDAPQERDAPGAPFPLGLMQHAYWIGRDAGQPLGGVAAHLYTEFDGPAVDPDRLRTALDRLTGRHEMLRTRLTPTGGQVIEPVARWRGLAVHDLRAADPEACAEHLAALRETWSHQVLDIEAGEVLAAALTLLPDGTGRLHLDIDMVAADAVSYRMLLADLADLYRDPERSLPEIGYSYRRYRSDRPDAEGPAYERAARWWRDRLPELPGAPELPTLPGEPAKAPSAGHGREPGRSPRVARRHLWLDPARRESLIAAARRRGLTPAMVLATAYAEVVGGWSATPRFLLNVPLFDREPVHPDVWRVVGDFSGSVLLAVDVAEPVPFAERARRVQARMHADAAHAAYPGLAVLRDLTRRAARQVLAPVVFTSALDLGELFAPEVRSTFGTAAWIISQGPQVLLDAQVTEVDGGLLVNWDSREDRFPAGVLDAMFAAYRGLVDDLAADGAAWRTPFGGGPRDQRATVTGAATGAVEVEAPVGPAARVAPRTALERAIALIWSRSLPVTEIGVHDEYFALGGDSVLAARIVAALRDGLDTTDVTVRTLFAAPTVAALAERLAAGDPERWEEVAEIFLEIESLSDEEVAARLDAEPGPAAEVESC